MQKTIRHFTVFFGCGCPFEAENVSVSQLRAVLEMFAGLRCSRCAEASR